MHLCRQSWGTGRDSGRGCSVRGCTQGLEAVWRLNIPCEALHRFLGRCVEARSAQLSAPYQPKTINYAPHLKPAETMEHVP